MVLCGGAHRRFFRPVAEDRPSGERPGPTHSRILGEKPADDRHGHLFVAGGHRRPAGPAGGAIAGMIGCVNCCLLYWWVTPKGEFWLGDTIQIITLFAKQALN
ncbi:hypothetical protein DESC_640017 [Desulfosarcina cetonica]|nr:hypothetical protein DESC_640017 [Desulfosarcina cetonica]